MSPTLTVRRLSQATLKLLRPSLADLFFVVLLLFTVSRPGGVEGLLADGDTGWHVRTGQLVLATGRVPVVDPFSFSRPGERWFAWEWLSDAIFALVWGRSGLGGVAVLSAVVLCLAAALLFAWLLRRGCGLWLALATSLAAVSASSVHHLARPHMFSILFFTVSLWIVDEDQRRPGWLLWTLAPLCGVWANLHAGFVVLPAVLALATGVELARRRLAGARRYGLAAGLSLVASLANPSGWDLHRHILAYLNSPWILDHVQEFQSPSIRSEGLVVFVVMLLAGACLAPRAMARGRWLEGLLVLGWAFASLRSARHIPFFAISGAPVVASECALWWRAAAESGAGGWLCRIPWELGRDLGRRWGPSVWLAAAALAVAVGIGSVSARAGGFPEARFPVKAVERNFGRLAPATGMPRILASDQWADYLIYRLYPRQRVFFDGRSDFYGPHLGADYRVLMGATPGWRELLERYRFRLALLPRDWPLSTMLDREPGWQQVYADTVAVLFERRGEP
jgi:hypothetical protein